MPYLIELETMVEAITTASKREVEAHEYFSRYPPYYKLGLINYDSTRE